MSLVRTWSLCLLSISLANLAAAAEPSPKLNVLFICADDLRAELGCYGSVAKTPHLDALARRSIVFERAYCQQAVCNPSRSSFLTGQRPDTLHLWNNGIHFREQNPNVVTLPQHFLAAGYTTRCVGKIFHNWHTAVKGDRRSWSADEYLFYENHGNDKPQINGKLPADHATVAKWAYGNTDITECREVADDAYFDGRVAAEAVQVMRQVKKEPFFLAVGFWKPHAPFNAPKKYWDLYDRAQLPRWNGSRPEHAVDIALHDSRELLQAPPKRHEPSPEQAAEMRHGYFANISYMDEQVGKVLQALDEHGLRERTVVVFLGDHGYHIGEHTLWGKTSNFEYDARVPLMISLPGAKGATTKSLAELVDLFPTLAETCGLKLPGPMDGISLTPVLREPQKSVKDFAFTQHPRPAYYDRTPAKTPAAMGYSVRTSTHRYTEWRGWEDGQLIGAELYDHRSDPAELRNVAADPPQQESLQAAKAALEKQFPAKTPPAKR